MLTLDNINNIDNVIEALNKFNARGKEFTPADVANMLRRGKHYYHYYSDDFKVSSKDEASFLAVDSGEEFNTRKRILLIFRVTPTGFKGAFVGDIDRYEKVIRDSDAKSSSDDPDLYYDVSQILGHPATIMETPGTFYRYMRSIRARVNHIIAKTTKNLNEEDFIIRGKNSYIVKTPLMDKFNNNIMFKFEKSTLTLPKEPSSTKIVGSKASMVATGEFTPEDLRKEIKVIQFFSNPSDLIFTGDIEDFDLESFTRLNHCIIERSERLKGSLKNYGVSEMAVLIVNAVRDAVSISKYDYNYIKPFYNHTFDAVNFLIPFSTKGGVVTEPELGIVIANNLGIWEIKTILSAEDSVSNLKTFSPYSDSWKVSKDNSSSIKDAVGQN